MKAAYEALDTGFFNLGSPHAKPGGAFRSFCLSLRNDIMAPLILSRPKCLNTSGADVDSTTTSGASGAQHGQTPPSQEELERLEQKDIQALMEYRKELKEWDTRMVTLRWVFHDVDSSPARPNLLYLATLEVEALKATVASAETRLAATQLALGEEQRQGEPKDAGRCRFFTGTPE